MSYVFLSEVLLEHIPRVIGVSLANDYEIINDHECSWIALHRPSIFFLRKVLEKVMGYSS